MISLPNVFVALDAALGTYIDAAQLLDNVIEQRIASVAGAPAQAENSRPNRRRCAHRQRGGKPGTETSLLVPGGLVLAGKIADGSNALRYLI